MTLYIDGHGSGYEVERLCRMFLSGQPLTVAEGSPEPDACDYIYTAQRTEGETVTLYVQIDCFGCKEQASGTLTPKEAEESGAVEQLFGVLLYRLLSKATGILPPWGILTGIRPVKLVRRFRGEGIAYAEIAQKLVDSYLLTPQKVRLLMQTADAEEKIVARSRPDSFSLYLAIPFCPSRCKYCSFVSHSVEQAGKLIPEYVRLLCDEVAYTAEITAQLGLRLETVYIGGGTPTTLSAEQLRILMETVRSSFQLDGISEYTVEAGRPDTITAEKLIALKEGGATRISINPQSLNDAVLRAAGRLHTAEEAVEAFELARRCGHTDINMDLIAGLEEDTLESYRSTIDRLMQLQPENITVHTLSIKRAARLAPQAQAVLGGQRQLVTDMLAYSSNCFEQNGYLPYYLYRQKNTLDNLENVGYCKAGHEGLYNVYIMDETHSIVALGAGAVTKLRQPYGDRIERIFNYKYPYEYIGRFPEVLRRKDGIRAFYRGEPIK